MNRVRVRVRLMVRVRVMLCFVYGCADGSEVDRGRGCVGLR